MSRATLMKCVFISYFSLFLLLNAVLLPYFANVISAKEFAHSFKDHVPKEAKLFSYNYEFYGTSFYLNRVIYRLSDDLNAEDYIVCFKKDFEGLQGKISNSYSLNIIKESDYPVENNKSHALLAVVKSLRAPS